MPQREILPTLGKSALNSGYHDIILLTWKMNLLNKDIKCFWEDKILQINLCT